MAGSKRSSEKYTMTISRLTVDKLGVKMYDKVSAVLAELVANSYDADATCVTIMAPMDQYLATKQRKKIRDKGFVIKVQDDGIGMTPQEVNEFYLRVGAERHTEDKRGRGRRSPIYKRRVMGRKGVGKLAPFGICRCIEVLTSGGEVVDGKDEKGRGTRGYRTAHLILDRNEILQESEFNYHPKLGSLDGIVRPATGTLITLSMFTYRQVPDMKQLERQLAQRFGIRSPDWRIELYDLTKTNTDPDYTTTVGEFEIVKMPDTEIRFIQMKPSGEKPDVPDNYKVLDSNNATVTDLQAGFMHDGQFYPVTGWVAYAKEPYKDDLMAGIRIYCHNKIAAQTLIFNRGAGFTGEYDVRSYLVGALNAEWLDEEEDLIQTDRRDILWSHELGREFEKWGQALVLKMGKVTRGPIKKTTWQKFQEQSNIHERIKSAFPADDQKPLREQALEFAQLFGQNMSTEEVTNPQSVEEVIQLTLLVAPHVTLDDHLRKAGDEAVSLISYVSELLEVARIASLASYGRIAAERVRIIERVEALKDNVATSEEELQDLIQRAPWLIDPQWTPLTANQTFSTLRNEFQKFYKAQTGEDIELGDFTYPIRRADFVLTTQENILQIIEIKKPHHTFANEEMIRLDRYIDMMKSFLAHPGHKAFRDKFPDFHVTLVCDKVGLTSVYKTAFDSHVSSGLLTYMTWAAFFANASSAHRDFLKEADRQRALSTKVGTSS
ncbi:MAG TPA: ATP-binding protein [Chloroflexia bacterium]|nr:ATP-binding protein [Chloroflexia bacterium]